VKQTRPLDFAKDSARVRNFGHFADRPHRLGLAAMSAVLVVSSCLVATPAAARPAAVNASFGWGYNFAGQLGDGTTADQASPDPITMPDGVATTAVSAGDSHSLAVGTDGNVYAWGDNSFGELGDGTSTDHSTPELIALPAGVTATAVSAGELFSLAIGSGNIYAWGINSSGQLGDGTTTSQLSPERIALPGGVTATAVSADSDFSLALGSDGHAYAWGDNTYGELGDGTGADHFTPEPISLPGGVNATAVSAGADSALALGSDGHVYAWGQNSSGQLGDGTTTSRDTPEEISLPGGVTATAVSAGNQFSLALGSDGNIYAWGDNISGQLGDGTTTSRDTPEEISLPGGVSATAVSAGDEFSLAVGSDGSVYAWGNNSDGQLGDGSTASRDTPEKISLPGGVAPTSVSAGASFSLASGSSALAAPHFTVASPALTAAAGSTLTYTFTALGNPAPAYALSSGAPSWLSIDATSGQLAGVVPAGLTSFSYSVTATNSLGSATAGPFTVTVQDSVTVSGSVSDNAGHPVDGAVIDACVTTGGICDTATTTPAGAFDVSALAGTTITLTAYPPPNLALSTDTTSAMTVPAGGLPGEVIILQQGNFVLPQGLLLNGSSKPELNWEDPATATVTGCPDGLATVGVAGQDAQPDIAVLQETPPGSGSYSGVIPPVYPVHGPSEIESSVSCPPQSELFPSLGPSTGGTAVIVTGAGFTGATGVSFGSTPAASYTVLSDQAIQASAPPGTGTVPVTVYHGAGPGGGVVTGQYTYVALQSVSPANGPAAGGTWVVIDGTGLLSATSVLFGQASAQFVQLSATQIEAMSPPGQGTQDITVTTLYGGTTPVTPADQFTYGAGAPGPGRSSPPGPVTVPRSPPPPVRPATDPVVAPAFSSPVPQGATGAGSDIGLRILQFIYQNAPTLLSNFKNIERQAQLATAALNPNCENNQQALVDAIKIAVNPYIRAAIAADLPAIEAFVAAAFSETGPADILIIYALTPLAVNWFVSEWVGFVIKVDVIAALGDCNEPKLTPPIPPPPPPPPGGTGGTGGGCSLGCNFAPDAYIDPSGTVLDTNGSPISGATATILRSDADTGPFAPVNIAAPGIEPAVNPETTTQDGAFHWDVDSGFYEVQATAPGCADPGHPAQPAATIGPYPVPPPQVGLAITLTCPGQAPPPVPSVASLSQSTGPPGGGTAVTVLGSGFTPSSQVRFGPRAARRVTYLSPQALTVISPPGTGPADVIVRTAGGSSATTAAGQFFYGVPPAITRLSLRTGAATGGTKVTISGTGFTGTTAVGFGTRPALSFVVESGTKIQATAPPEKAGTIDVEVVNRLGASAPTAADHFTYRDVPATGVLYGVAATSARSAIAVGQAASGQTLIMGWNGKAWKHQASPTPPGGGAFYAVAATSARSAWAVGGSGNRPYPTEIAHWNGTAWKHVRSPAVGGTLLAVTATSARNAWAVGCAGDCSSSTADLKTLILHWNGTAWKRVPSPSPGPGSILDSVTAISGRNAWAVGCASHCLTSSARPATLILHWNGSAWKRVPSPAPAKVGALTGVTATSARNAWTVGCAGYCFGPGATPGTLILHWNGTTWKRIPSPSPAGGSLLSGITATSARDAWAVGTTRTSSSTLTLRWHGTSWLQVPSPTPAPGGELTAVAASSARNAWAVGENDDGNLILQHWNGTAWK
jgi:alpha-tubulin suppressor-like RCC1 family protein